ncbi:MAG: hypothetical protein Q8N62_02955 [Candidatus Omnitrophota bacterium]|nr:hypothetical protein [Candidatus Omnitrophota bacterium]
MWEWILVGIKGVKNIKDIIEGWELLKRFGNKNKEKNDREYKFISYHKDITIFKNNHGILQFSSKLKVEKNSFKMACHFFTLIGCGLKGMTLDSLPTLIGRINDDPGSRFDKQTLCCKLISINKKTIEHNDRWLRIESNLLEEESPIRRSFSIKFKDKIFKKGDEIVYLWGYSCPKLYPVNKEQMSSFSLGTFDDHDYSDDCRSVSRLSNDMDELCFTVSFEEGINLGKSPELWIRNQKSHSNHHLVNFKKEEDLYYTRYSAKIRNGRHGNDYVVRWWYI